MKKAIYEQIVETIKNEEWDFDQVLEILIEKFPEEKPETLRSIVTLEYQKQVKKTAKPWDLKKSQTADHKRRELFNKFNFALNSKDYKEGVIVELAKNRHVKIFRLTIKTKCPLTSFSYFGAVSVNTHD